MKLFRTNPPPAPEASSAELKAALADAEANQATNEATMQALEAERGDVLLGGDIAAVEKHEAALRSAREEKERIVAVIAALGPRIAAAEAREHVLALRAEVEEAERLSAAVVKDVRAYVVAARDLLILVERINAATARVEGLNGRLHRAGRPDLQVIPPIRRMWPKNGNAPLCGIAMPTPQGWRATTLQGFDLAIKRHQAGRI